MPGQFDQGYPMRKRLALAVAAGVAVPLLVAAAATGALLLGGGDQPVSSRDPAPSAPPGRDDPLGTVTGTVTSSTGEPVAGATVQPRSLDDPSPPIPELVVQTDPDGRYTWRLPPGEYELSAQLADGTTSSPQPATVTAGATTTVDLTVP